MNFISPFFICVHRFPSVVTKLFCLLFSGSAAPSKILLCDFCVLCG